MKKTFLIIVLALLTMVMSAQTYGIDHEKQKGFTNRLRNSRNMIFLMKRFCITTSLFGGQK